MYLVGPNYVIGVVLFVCVVTCDEGEVWQLTASKLAELTVGKKVRGAEPIVMRVEGTMGPKLYNQYCPSLCLSSTSDIA